MVVRQSAGLVNLSPLREYLRMANSDVHFPWSGLFGILEAAFGAWRDADYAFDV